MQQILKGGFIMVNVNEMTLDLTKELAFSKEELKELENAKTKKIVFDEDWDMRIKVEYLGKEYYSENHRISEDIFSNHIIQNGRNNVPIINLVSGNNPYDYKDYENVDNSYIIGYFQNIE